MRRHSLLLIGSAFTLVLLFISLFSSFNVVVAACDAGANTSVVSLFPDGSTASAVYTTLSGNGRFVGYTSSEDGIDPTNLDNNFDAYIYDRLTCTTELISKSTSGVLGNGAGVDPNSLSLSSDGRLAAFAADSSNLVASDTNNRRDVFVRDRQTGQTTRVSVSSSGAEGDSDSTNPRISANGRYVVFDSISTNFATDDDAFLPDVFLHDRQTGQTTLISVSQGTGAGEGIFPDVSADGNEVIFNSLSTMSSTANCAGVYVRSGNQTRCLIVATNDFSITSLNNPPALSSNGQRAGHAAFFPSNSSLQAIVQTVSGGSPTTISVNSSDTLGNGNSDFLALSSDGRYVVFRSSAANLLPWDNNGSIHDVFLRDMQTGTLSLVSVGRFVGQGGSAGSPSISGDGAAIVFLASGTVICNRDVNCAVVRGRYEGMPAVTSTPSPSPTETEPPVATATGTPTVTPSPTLSRTPTLTFTPSPDRREFPLRNHYAVGDPLLTWQGTSLATTYQVQVDDSPTFTAPLRFETTVPGAQLQVQINPALTEGQYFWRVRACTSPTTCGAWSAVDSFVIDLP